MYLLNKRKALKISHFLNVNQKSIQKPWKQLKTPERWCSVTDHGKLSLWLTGWPSAGSSLRWWAMQKCQPVCSQGFCNCFQMDACAKLKRKRRRRKMNLLLRNCSYNNFALKCSHNGVFLGKHESLYSG